MSIAIPIRPARRGPATTRILAGTFAYLTSIALVALTTVVVFFGLGFLLLLHPPWATIAGSGVGIGNAEVTLPPRQDLTVGRNSDAVQQGDKGSPSAAQTEPPSFQTVAALPSDASERPSITNKASTTETRTVAPSAIPPSPPDTPVANDTEPRSSGDGVPQPSETAIIAPPRAEESAKPAANSSGTPSPTMPSPRLAAAEIAELLARGDGFLRISDVASARLYYERAADAGDGRAALRIGATFDPAFLARAGLGGVRGDVAKTRFWYSRALDLGAAEAVAQLNSLEKK